MRKLRTVNAITVRSVTGHCLKIDRVILGEEVS